MNHPTITRLIGFEGVGPSGCSYAITPYGFWPTRENMGLARHEIGARPAKKIAGIFAGIVGCVVKCVAIQSNR